MRLPCLFVLALVLGLPASGQLPQVDFRPNPVFASTRLRLVASIDPATIKLGSPVVVGVVLTNISVAPVHVMVSGSEDYQPFVTDSSGRELQRTEVGNRLFRFDYPLIRAENQSLKPGEELHAGLDIRQIYNLTQPGTYSVQVFRIAIFGDPVSIPASKEEAAKVPIEKAVSNKVQFTITP